MALGMDCNKQNARRSGKHKDFYANCRARSDKRKDRNVKRSTHGHYQTRAELVAYQTGIEAKRPKVRKPKAVKVIVPVDPWTGRKGAWGLPWEAK